MKKIISIIGLGLVLLGGCSKNEIKEEVGTLPTDDAVRTLALVTGVPTTRATWTDGEGIAWNEGDASVLGFISDAGDAKNADALEIGDEDGRAKFTVSVTATAENILTYAPVTTENVQNSEGNYNISLSVDAEQLQSKGAIWSLNTMPMASTKVLSAKGEVVENDMTLLGAVVRFIVYDASEANAYASEKIVSVSLEVPAGSAINGQAVIAGDWNSEDSYNVSYVGNDEGANITTVTLGEQISLEGKTANADAEGVYMAVLPVTVEAGQPVIYRVTTDEATYSFTSTVGKDFKANNIYNMPLNLAKGVRKLNNPSVLTFRKALESNLSVNGLGETKYAGWYIVAVDGVEQLNDNSEVYRVYRFVPEYEEGDTEDWLYGECEIADRCVDVIAKPNNTGKERTAKLHMIFDGNTEKYVIPSLANIDDPIHTFTVTQSAADHSEIVELYYKMSDPMHNVFDWTNGTPVRRVDVDGVSGSNLEYFYAYTVEDDVERKVTDYPGYYSGLECLSSEDWCSAYVGSNHIYINVEPNTNEFARTATITVRFPVDRNLLIKVYDPATKEVVEDGKIFEFTISQRANVPVQLKYEWATNPKMEFNVDYKTHNLDGGIDDVKVGTIEAFISEDGTEWEKVSDSKYYDFEFDAGDASEWLEGLMNWGTQIYAPVVQENNTGEVREGYLKMSAKPIDNVTMPENPIATFHVIQQPNKTEE